MNAKRRELLCERWAKKRKADAPRYVHGRAPKAQENVRQNAVQLVA
jgi:hypothetical protein